MNWLCFHRPKCFGVLALLALYALPAFAVLPDPKSPTVLITGANASHGLAFAEEYAALGWNVIATCRSPETADELNALAAANSNVQVEQLDIVDDTEIAALAEKLQNVPIDVLPW